MNLLVQAKIVCLVYQRKQMYLARIEILDLLSQCNICYFSSTFLLTDPNIWRSKCNLINGTSKVALRALLNPISPKHNDQLHISHYNHEPRLYSMPQTVWNSENVSKWTSNVQLLCSTAFTYWIIYSWLTSNLKVSIWAQTRAKIHSFSKCQNSDHFWVTEKNMLRIQPHHKEICLLWWRDVFWAK